MRKEEGGISLVVQWLRLHTSTAEDAWGLDSILGQETKILRAAVWSEKGKLAECTEMANANNI